MSFKRFISGVCAFAVAVTAFAAVAVTASAKDYEPIDVISKTQKNNVTWSKGIATASTLTAGQYSAAKIDFSDLEGISEATSVKLQFDTYVKSGDMVLYGVGDASYRNAVANGSGGYKSDGLAMYFGSTNGSNYGAYNVKSESYAFANPDSDSIGKWITAKFTFDTNTKKCLYEIGSQIGEIDTNIDNLTYLDAYTNKSGGQYGFKNVKVSYTVPDPLEVDDSGYFETGDNVYAKAYTAVIDCTGKDTISSITVYVDGSKEKFKTIEGPKMTGVVAKIGIILASKNNNITEPTVKVTVQ